MVAIAAKDDASPVDCEDDRHVTLLSHMMKLHWSELKNGWLTSSLYCSRHIPDRLLIKACFNVTVSLVLM